MVINYKKLWKLLIDKGMEKRFENKNWHFNLYNGKIK